jgi:hypothetical protein
MVILAAAAVAFSRPALFVFVWGGVSLAAGLRILRPARAPSGRRMIVGWLDPGSRTIMGKLFVWLGIMLLIASMFGLVASTLT